ncbi:MAG TPA: hypothetical protein VL754_11365 [Verrucomicrobiae bacterium]|nr:hypothetical protein [Verrucomicrobiae bacterium]
MSFAADVKDFLYGLTGYEFARHALETRREVEKIFLAATLGDLVGIPVMPPVYSLRLLPYVLPEIEKWKREMARTKELWEREEFDLHGI